MGNVMCSSEAGCGDGCRRVHRREAEVDFKTVDMEYGYVPSRPTSPFETEVVVSTNNSTSSHTIPQPGPGHPLLRLLHDRCGSCVGSCPEVQTHWPQSRAELREALRPHGALLLAGGVLLLAAVLLSTLYGPFVRHGSTETPAHTGSGDQLVTRPRGGAGDQLVTKPKDGAGSRAFNDTVSVIFATLAPTASEAPTTSAPVSRRQPAASSGTTTVPTSAVDPCSVGACRPGCPMPCLDSPDFPACLCLFGIDRTLTGQQGTVKTCPGNEEVPGVIDTSHGTHGTLVLSNLAQSIEGTFCSRCFRGVMSTSDVGGEGSENREVIVQVLGGAEASLSEQWSAAPSSGTEAQSPLVVGAVEGKQPEAARSIVSWFKSRHGVTISDDRVHFFSDRRTSVLPFNSTNFNARQVSCKTRADGGIGLCGAVAAEIVEDAGVAPCPKS
mmetsp:Transcript_13035/g.25063  ORF Transcript_13035/g.25063 Transcript_13035/m.25063 type:complete len:440 (-) Transcript_13035:213-1532(-)